MSKIKHMLKKYELLGFMLRIYGYFLKFWSIPKWNKLKKEQRIHLELGSGKKRGVDGWTTVDRMGSDINYDLTFGIPLPDNSVEKIYTSHLLEHIPFEALVVFLNECHRVLKVGGLFLVCVPDAGRYIRSYLKNEHFGQDARPMPISVNTGSALDQVNHIAYMRGAHHYMFDEENLIKTRVIGSKACSTDC